MRWTARASNRFGPTTAGKCPLLTVKANTKTDGSWTLLFKLIPWYRHRNNLPLFFRLTLGGFHKMTASIPASAIVNVNPNVIASGGTGLDLVGLFLTRTATVPVGTVATFTSAAAVEAYFGGLSVEAILAATYFSGFKGSAITPAKMHFASYSVDAVPAYLRGGRVSGLTLPELKALTGVLTFDIDERAVVSGTINLSAANSFSDAATIIQTGIADSDAQVTGAIAGTVLTVTAVASGALAIGQIIKGTGIIPGTRIVSFGTGEGDTGTYNISETQTAASTSVTAGQTLVTYDSVAGAFVITAGTPGAGQSITVAAGSLSGSLRLTAELGAVVSPGGDALTPGAQMTALAAFTQDFASFATTYEAATQDAVAFAAWADGQNNRFLYLMGDSDVTATTSSAGATAGGLIVAADYSGTMLIYDPTDPAKLCAFVAGAIASIDFGAREGRANLAFRALKGLVPGVTDKLIGDQLITNKYNFYGAYATAADRFIFLYPGQVTGEYLWADSFVNQVWLSNNFQLALMRLLTTVKSVPYNAAGYALIAQGLAGPINEALAFGAVRTGVPLSAEQAITVNTEAGVPVDRTIGDRGWYLSIKPASPTVRAARGSPPITFFYTDGQSIQKISLNSVQVQ